MSQLKTSAEIIEFWFSERVSKLWFQSTPEFDREICQQFEMTFAAGVRDELQDWELSAEGLLALVVLFDQFPLNMYRGQVLSFSTENNALTYAKQVVDNGWDLLLSDTHKAFIYMSYMHSENLSDQDQAIALFEQAGSEENAKYAHHHRNIIVRFGRFPHRNAILGRQSTPEELAYLKAKEAFLG